MTEWVNAYVGLPFIDHGRNGNGVDCWGLVRLVMQREKGIVLPSYGEISARDLVNVTETIRHDSNVEPWIPVSGPRAFDVLLMRGRPMHVGIMCDSERVLHIEENISAVLLPITHNSIRFRMLGFRRHRELLDAAA